MLPQCQNRCHLLALCAKCLALPRYLLPSSLSLGSDDRVFVVFLPTGSDRGQASCWSGCSQDWGHHCWSSTRLEPHRCWSWAAATAAGVCMALVAALPPCTSGMVYLSTSGAGARLLHPVLAKGALKSTTPASPALPPPAVGGALKEHLVSCATQLQSTQL